MKFGRIVLQVTGIDGRSQMTDMTSYFQDGSHDVRPPLHMQQRLPAAR